MGGHFLVPGNWNVLAHLEGLPVLRVGEEEKYRQYSKCGMFQMLQIPFKTQTRQDVRMCEAGSPPQPPPSPDKDIQLSVCLTLFAVHRLLQSQLVQPKHRSYCLSTLWSKCASLKTKRFHLKPTSVKKQNKRNITLLGEQSAGGNGGATREHPFNQRRCCIIEAQCDQ